MATKDSHTFLGNDRKHSNSNSFSQQSDQYNNLNLNQNQKHPVIDHSQLKRNSSDSKSTKNYKTPNGNTQINFPGTAASKALDQFVEENGDRERKTFSWNKADNGFHSMALNGLNNYDSKEDVEDQKRWKNCDSLLKNESTLSLHIATSENLVEVKKSDEPLKVKPKTKTLEDVKKAFAESHSKNPFEFPRQKNISASEPELSKFKASQRLLNSNSNANDCVRVNTRINRVVQIVEHVAEGQFKVNEEALGKLLLTERVANKKVVIYCIAGESRGGKSFLLNFGIDKLNHDEEQKGKFPSETWNLHASKRLAGFEFQKGVNPTTMGIWAWDHVPLIKHGDEEYAVLMIDSQGTFDKKTTCGDGSTIFSMAGIFSSYFCYNVEKNLHENKLNELYSFNLVVIVRDFQDEEYLKLKNGGQIYVENELAPAELNKETRDRINASYEKLYGFILPHPGNAVALKNSSIIGEMEDEFVSLTKEMFETLLSPSTLQPKHIGNKTLTCKEAFTYFIDTVKCFSDNKGYAPKAMYALRRDFLINLEVDRAIDMYKSQMDKVFLNCKTGYESAELIDIHESIVEDLINDFEKLNKSISADAFEVILDRIDKLFDAYERNNEKLVEAEKKRVQEVEAEREHKENVARYEKEKAEEEVKKAEVEAQAQKEKMNHEKIIEYVKLGAGIVEAVGNIFNGFRRRRFY
uniref:GB1/RHD3-type G domain-containing protein n=1 Tax=Panagrolaimus sp. PS1159 TaxID=55785 RepID=A0AC35GH22_9BILA